jgi:hypothetical protein
MNISLCEYRWCSCKLNQLMFELKSLTSSIILDMTYGIKIESFDDGIIKIAVEGVNTVTDLGADGLFLVDLLPILRFVPSWFPGASFHKKAEEGRKISQCTLEMPYQLTIEMMVRKFVYELLNRPDADIPKKTGNYPPSFLTNALEELGESPNANGSQLIKEIAGQIFLGKSHLCLLKLRT